MDLERVPRKRKRKRGRWPRLGPGEFRFWLKRFYYECLNEVPAFRQDLEGLFAELDRLGMPALLRPPGFWADPLHVSPALVARFQERGLPGHEALGRVLAARQAMEALCQRWPLPWDALADLWFSYRARSEQGALLLPALPFAPGPSWPTEASLVEAAGPSSAPSEGVRVVALQREPWIYPPLPLPLHYDPTRQARADLDARVARLLQELLASIEAQARALELAAEAAGWRPPPAEYADLAEVRRGARRLFRRVVRGESWRQIAEQVDPARGERAAERQNVRRQVATFAELLGIALGAGPKVSSQPPRRT